MAVVEPHSSSTRLVHLVLRVEPVVARNPGIVGFAHDLLDYDEQIETIVPLRPEGCVDCSVDGCGAPTWVAFEWSLDGSIVEATGWMTGGSSARGSRPSFGGAGAASAGI